MGSQFLDHDHQLDRTFAPTLEGQILNHWTTGEVYSSVALTEILLYVRDHVLGVQRLKEKKNEPFKSAE